MSFVLEALKKQEADSNPEAAAALAVAGLQHRRYRLWAGVAIGALVLNLAVLAWLVMGPWWRPPAPVTAPSPAVVVPTDQAPELPHTGDPAAAPPQAPMQAPMSAAPAVPAVPTAPAAAVPSAPVTAPATAIQPAPAPAPRLRRVGLQNLPSDARRRFPGIAFSTHVYAEDPELRAVVANGQRLVEGDRIRGLMIEEISADGVTLRFEDFLVEVPLIADWDAPE